jgi:hypothetical protein
VKVRKVKFERFLMVLMLFSVCFVASTSFVSAANNTTIHAANTTVSAHIHL